MNEGILDPLNSPPDEGGLEFGQIMKEIEKKKITNNTYRTLTTSTI